MAMTLITTNDGSGVATSDFTSGIDNTYKLYIFKWYDVNPVTDNTHFSFQVNASGQSGYNETMTTTAFRSYHAEDDGSYALEYETGHDQAQGTSFQVLGINMGNGGDESCAGELHLFNPSNTTYVKHFYGRSNQYYQDDKSGEFYTAGYIDVTAAITGVQFKMSSGNMDAVIKMYGVS